MAGDASERTRALAWLEQQVRARHGGKVLLVGFDSNGPVAAWAAGLAGEQDYPNFTIFARFALQKLAACSSYWLFLPVEFEDCLGYRMQLQDAGETWFGEARWQDGARWTLQEHESQPLLEDLLMSAGTLPGLMRRDLTALSKQLEIDPPEPVSGTGQ